MHPSRIDHGNWTCEEQQIPVPDEIDFNGDFKAYPGNEFNVKFKFSSPLAHQCRLDCEPGYMSDLPPITTCVLGNFVPHRPEKFTCQQTVALLVSDEGEMEVFGEEETCNRLMTNIPPLSLTGHSISLLDRGV